MHRPWPGPDLAEMRVDTQVPGPRDWKGCEPLRLRGGDAHTAWRVSRAAVPMLWKREGKSGFRAPRESGTSGLGFIVSCISLQQPTWHGRLSCPCREWAACTRWWLPREIPHCLLWVQRSASAECVDSESDDLDSKPRHTTYLITLLGKYMNFSVPRFLICKRGAAGWVHTG